MNRKTFLIGLASAAVLALAWALAAHVVAAPFILPGPAAVLRDCVSLALTPDFWRMFGATLWRGLSAFSVSLALSSALGFASGVRPGFSAALRPWMTVIKSTPVVSFILIAILWFGSSIVPVFVAVLMTVPVMTEAIAQGVRSADPKLLLMARCYRFGKWKTVMQVRIPSAMPYFLGGAGASLGLTWKVVVAGEILSVPRAGLGTAMQTAKVQLETARVFSLTAAAILLSVATEFAFDRFVCASRRHAGKAGND